MSALGYLTTRARRGQYANIPLNPPSKGKFCPAQQAYRRKRDLPASERAHSPLEGGGPKGRGMSRTEEAVSYLHSPSPHQKGQRMTAFQSLHVPARCRRYGLFPLRRGIKGDVAPEISLHIPRSRRISGIPGIFLLVLLPLMLFAGLCYNAAADEEPHPFGAVLTSPDARAEFDAQGRLLTLRWPGQGAPSHLGGGPIEEGESPAGIGAFWSIRLNGEEFALPGANGDVAFRWEEDEPGVLRMEREIAGTVLTETAFLHPELPVLVSTAEAPGEHVAWYGALQPVANPLPEMAFLDNLWRRPAGFALVTPDDGARWLSVRPQRAGARRQSDLAFLKRQPLAEAAWEDLGRGTWLTLAADPPPTEYQAGNLGEDDCALAAFHEETLNNTPLAHGEHENLALRFPDAEQDAYTIMLAFGETRREAEEALETALERGAAQLREETAAHWEGAHQEIAEFESLREPWRDFGYAMRMALEQSMGSSGLLRRPYPGPSPPVIRPRETPWFVIGLHQAGLGHRAEAHLRFLSQQVREEDDPTAPRGSLPYALHEDGEPAWPRFLTDLQGAAHFLWALEIHHGAFGGEGEFLEEVWPSAELAAEFLTTWKDRRTWRPRPSFQPGLGRDAYTAECSLAAFRGMQSAIALARERGDAPSHWEDRLEELEAVLRRDCLTGEGEWLIDAPLRHWHTNALPLEDPAWLEWAAPGAEDSEHPIARLHELLATAHLAEHHPGLRRELGDTLSAILPELVTGASSVEDASRTPIADPYRAALGVSILHTGGRWLTR